MPSGQNHYQYDLISKTSSKKLNICMISGFFYPNIGGVETHIFELSRHLIQNGHKVIIITHQYPRFQGVYKMIDNQLKVYYLPLPVMFRQCIWTNFVNLSSYLRKILIDEKIDILHSHGGFSTMAQEAQLFGNFLNLGLVFTEHSLHGFSDLGSFALNGIWKLTTKPVDKCIGVSYCQTVNQFYRLGGDNYLESQSSKFMTVPNAIYPDQYLPPDIESEDAYRTIVVVSRLTGRKGTPLMVATIEKLFKQPRYRHLKLLLAGDGPCMIQVEELREKYRWHDRITTLGSVQPSQVRSVLNQGRVFLNCSLSEAFCMAIVEAACSGLHVVTTDVGGIPEVLPDDHLDLRLELSKPDVDNLLLKLEKAVNRSCDLNPSSRDKNSDSNFNQLRWKQHQIVKNLYTWVKISKKVENVYHEILQNKSNLPLGDRVDQYLYGDSNSNPDKIQISGILFQFMVVINLCYWWILDRIDGKNSLDRVLHPEKYRRMVNSN